MHAEQNELPDRLRYINDFFFLLSLDCADGWHQFKTGCIKFFTTSLTKMKAKEKCEEFETSNHIKGSLIKIPSSDDNDKVVSLSPTSGAFFVMLFLVDDHIYSETGFFF